MPTGLSDRGLQTASVQPRQAGERIRFRVWHVAFQQYVEEQYVVDGDLQRICAAHQFS